DHIDNKFGWPGKRIWGSIMAAKRRPPRSAKVTQTKKKAKAPAKKGALARKIAVLRLAAERGDARVRRAVEAYVGAATELEAARIKRAETDQALAAAYAAKALQENRPHFDFLAQGDSWFDYPLGKAIIQALQALFGENASFYSMAKYGLTLQD